MRYLASRACTVESLESSSSRSFAVQHLLLDRAVDTAEEHDEKGQVTGERNLNAYMVERIPGAHG